MRRSMGRRVRRRIGFDPPEGRQVAFIPPDPCPRPKPIPKPLPGAGFADPGIPYPAQVPAARPLIAPLPNGPVPSPPGIVVSSFLKDCLLLPCHGGSTLRALLLCAGRIAFMRFAMPALRTQAGAGRASREGTAHAASTSAPSTPPLSAARPPGACSVSSWHCHVLLSGTAHSPAAAPPATAATGHGERCRAPNRQSARPG